jgi:hypothetical protein
MRSRLHALTHHEFVEAAEIDLDRLEIRPFDLRGGVLDDDVRRLGRQRWENGSRL